jgi:rhodanese-related sulfurtransferase
MRGYCRVRQPSCGLVIVSTLPSTTTAHVRKALIERSEIALLDVREEGPFAEAHPLFAASLPVGRIELEIADRVPRRSTQIVVYDNGEGLNVIAVERLRALGYTDVSILEGGLDGWRQAGGEIFRDVNTPSKAFGELVEARRHTPSLSAVEVKALLDAHADVVVLDARRFDEYRTMSIPTAVSVPGAELVYRVQAAALSPSSLVVVNCAGRTRSIIGTQSLVNAGIPNRVAALRNGTIGWTLAGFALEHGQMRSAPALSRDTADRSRVAARRVAERAGVRRVVWSDVAAWDDGDVRTRYRFDVRSPEEYARGHVPGFRSTPGGQLVQETDVFAPVRGARIVLWDAEQTRADMTASWLAQMGWDVSVIDDASLDEAGEIGPWRPTLPPLPEVPGVEPSELETELTRGAVLVDVASSVEYLRGHIPGAWLVSRTSRDIAVAALPRAAHYIVTSVDGLLASFFAPELATITGARVSVLTKGTAAWISSGRALRSGGDRLTMSPIDVYKRPYEGTDNDAQAMQAYLDWEYGLVAQLERDGTHGFHVI